MSTVLDEITLGVIDRIGNTPDKLLEILMEVQRISDENYVSKGQLKTIAKSLGIPLSKVYGVATFYSMLSTEKRGKYVIQVCNSGPCYINDTIKLSTFLENILGIKMGEVTEDGLFSLEYTSCIGACDVAPAIKINDRVYGNLNRQKVVDIISTLRKELN